MGKENLVGLAVEVLQTVVIGGGLLLERQRIKRVEFDFQERVDYFKC